jgi:chemotaxis signal transduction protein
MTGNDNRFLIVSASGERYAIDLGDIAEVTEKYHTCPIPKAPPYYLGAFNFHGTPAPVVDLASTLNDEAPRQGGVILVLDHRIATLAVRVDSVERIVYDVPVSEMNADGDDAAERSLLWNDETVRILVLESFVASLEIELRQGNGNITRPATEKVHQQ